MVRRVAAAIFAITVVASPAAADSPTRKAARKLDPDAMRCVKTPITGYLARYQRICMTNREWEQGREDARRMQTQICSDQTRCAGS